MHSETYPPGCLPAIAMPSTGCSWQQLPTGASSPFEDETFPSVALWSSLPLLTGSFSTLLCSRGLCQMPLWAPVDQMVSRFAIFASSLKSSDWGAFWNHSSLHLKKTIAWRFIQGQGSWQVVLPGWIVGFQSLVSYKTCVFHSWPLALRQWYLQWHEDTGVFLSTYAGSLCPSDSTGHLCPCDRTLLFLHQGSTCNLALISCVLCNYMLSFLNLGLISSIFIREILRKPGGCAVLCLWR